MSNPTFRALGVVSLFVLSAHASAIPVRVSITNVMEEANLMGQQGGVITPLWASFHDGSFDTFTPGTTASSGVEHIAEDGLVGLEANVPGFIDLARAAGLRPESLPPPETLIDSQFGASPAGQSGGTQGIITVTPVGIVPGATLSRVFELDENSGSNDFFSYAAMFIPSNDAFFADEEPIRVFGPDGAFIGAEILVAGADIWDAGTEVNTDGTLAEANATIPVNLAVVGEGTPENGVISRHQGLGAGALAQMVPNGGPGFAGADFSAPGFQVARITVTRVSEPSTLAAPLLVAVLGLHLARRRRASPSV